jgi:hypothetical protein
MKHCRFISRGRWLTYSVIKIALSTRQNAGGASQFFSSEEGNMFLEMLYSFWNIRQWVAFRNQVQHTIVRALYNYPASFFLSLPYKIERQGGTGYVCLKV